MRTRWSTAVILGAFLFAPMVQAKAEMYYGAEKCKTCHSVEVKGNQYGVWAKMAHAKAFQTLATEEAKKIAKEKGIDDPQKSDKCLKCHVTAFEAPQAEKHKKFSAELGIQCESCHGPGEKHVKARLMGDPPKDDVIMKIEEGEIIHTPTAETCKKCHNKESPSYKEFCFKEASKKTAHLDPRRKHGDDHFDKLPCDCPKCKGGGEAKKEEPKAEEKKE